MNPYRADVVGSMLRPQYLLEARESYAGGNISHADFKAIEDQAVDECVDIQKRAGVDVVTDGEMRRAVFASQLAQSCDGFDRVQNNEVDWFTLDGRVERSPVTVGLVSKIKRRRHLSSEEYVYLRAKTNQPRKITLPSPTMYAYYWVPGVSNAAYPTTDAYMADIVDILRDEVSELVRLGAEYIQFDAPEFGMIIDPHQQEWFGRKGFRPERMLHDGIAMIDAIVTILRWSSDCISAAATTPVATWRGAVMIPSLRSRFTPKHSACSLNMTTIAQGTLEHCAVCRTIRPLSLDW